MTARIERIVTTGTFSLDEETHEVSNNVWTVGNDKECVVIDPAHDVDAVLSLVGEREVVAVLCTHAHDDHVAIAPEVAERTGAPVLLNPQDADLWALTHADRAPDGELHDGQLVTVAGVKLEVISTPGHTPGGVCLWWEKEGILFSGDTLFEGGPGATGRSYSDRETLENSIRERLFPLGDEVRVKTGHGEDTTIGAERAADWVEASK